MAFNSLDIAFLVCGFSEIFLAVGYWLYISENRKWIDRFLDFLALLIVTFLSLILNYGLWLYVNITIDVGFIFWFLFGSIFALQLYGYHQFSKRTFLADYFMHHQRIPMTKQPTNSTKSTGLTEVMKSKKSIKAGSEEVRCPKCNSVIEQLGHSVIIENLSIFCPFCGEKVMRYEIVDLSESELIEEHNKIIQQLDQQTIDAGTKH